MRKFTKSRYDFTDNETVSIIDEVPFWSAPFGFKLLDSIKLKQNITVVDIGSGTGFPVIELANRLGKTCKVYGIDPWDAALARAQKKIDIFGMQNIQLLKGAAESIPLPDASVDLVISNNGINNVQDVTKVFNEIKRITKQGAQFAATVNLDGTMKEFYQIFEEVLSDLGLSEIIPSLKNHIYEKRRPVEEFRNLLLQNGFKNIVMSEDSFSYKFVDGSAMFDHPVIQYAFMDSWMNLVPQDKVDKVFNEIELRMNNKSKINGEWILTIPFVLMNAERA